MSGVVEVEYFTDPLCCWSWAMEPGWRRLRFQMRDRISVRCRFGGMIPDWTTYGDPLNDVGSAAQMGPYWYRMRTEHGLPLDERVWVEDPPGSSFPASVACKAAGRQGADAGEAYLRRVREAVMLERRNVARREVLLELAEELEREERLDAAAFADDLQGEAALRSFRDDVKEARYRGIGRFPALLLHPPRGPSRLLVGFRPYALLREQVEALSPVDAPMPARPPCCAVAYARHWGSVLAGEVSEALEIDLAEAERALDAAAAAGELERTGEPRRERYRARGTAPCSCGRGEPRRPLRAMG